LAPTGQHDSGDVFLGMHRVIRAEEDAFDGVSIERGKHRVARRMHMQVPEPLNTRLCFPQFRKEVSLECIITRTEAVGVPGATARVCHVRDHIAVAFAMAEEGYGKLEPGVLASKGCDPNKNSVS
jgi:hypothetical protein